eukprot:1258311-Amphidinium_carterae.1
MGASSARMMNCPSSWMRIHSAIVSSAFQAAPKGALAACHTAAIGRILLSNLLVRTPSEYLLDWTCRMVWDLFGAVLIVYDLITIPLDA